MAPTGLFDKLKQYYSGEPEPPVPAISTRSAVALLVLYTFFYVIPLYVFPSTRPSPNLHRDSPAVIQARVRSVTISCFVCSVFTFVLCSSVDGGNSLHSIHLMGYFPIGFTETAKTLFLTCILFAGPLFESGIVEGGWRDWIRFRGVRDVFTNWVDWRNIVVGPVTEEVLFRSTGIPPLILAQASLTTTVFLTPLVFGLAHVHHFYEFRLIHPNTPVTAALLRSLFQLGYTTLFGGYATFVFLRTGSLLAVILIHAFCNCMGLPRVWGRLEGRETLMGPDDLLGSAEGHKKSDDHAGPAQSGRLHIVWTAAYYSLLFVGAIVWWKNLWTLTESPLALISFASKSK